MNYRRNEDKWPIRDIPSYNSIIEVSFVEGTWADPTFTAGTPVEPVTLAEVKTELDITFTDYDTKLTSLIKQCRAALEKHLGISLVAKRVTAVLNNGNGNMELPYGPLVSMTSATDLNGDVIQSTDYILRGETWKYIETPVTDYTKYIYITGYTTVPEDLKKALLMEIAWRFENPGYKNVSGLSEQAKLFAAPYSRKSWII